LPLEAIVQGGLRYCGLAKNTAQLHTLFALANLWMVRRRLSGSLA